MVDAPRREQRQGDDPIVFCASFEPWLNAISAAEMVCALRKPLLAVAGRALRKVQYSAVARSAPTMSPISASDGGTTTLSRMPCHFTSFALAAESTAPTSPPISACDELEGMP